MEIRKGDKFGLLTVIQETPKPENRKTKGKYYLCQCECGNQKIADKSGLIRGGVKSCGCLRAKRVSESITIDITGKRFGRLTVLEKVDYKDTPQKSQAMWKCKCDCGNITVVRGTQLRQGKTKSCGCLQKEKAHDLKFINETGNRYGKLIVVKFSHIDEKKEAAIWLCKCDCGNYKEVLGTNLRNGHTNSCGCLVSKGESIITSILQEKQIKYKSQFTCKTLRTNKQGQYKFDFALLNNNDAPIGMIEYNGRQHYEETNFFEKLEDVQFRDKEKQNWCKINNIPLLTIPYTIIDKEEIKKRIINFYELITKINDDGTLETKTERDEIE